MTLTTRRALVVAVVPVRHERTRLFVLCVPNLRWWWILGMNTSRNQAKAAKHPYSYGRDRPGSTRF